MTPRELIAAFETLADAPDGVKRLRELVLHLAVRGKLVPQLSADEPVSELLKKIAAGRVKVAESLRTRQPNSLAGISRTDDPYDIPESWHWCRLQDLGVIVAGGTPSSSDPGNFCEEGGVPWITPADMRACTQGKFISRGARNLTERGLSSCSAQLMPKGTVVFSSRAPIGYVAIAANTLSTNQGFKSLAPGIHELSEFVRLYLMYAGPLIDAVAPGTTFKEVSGAFMAAYPVPLPPLAEQHRIVARVDELMGLLDRLEAACTARDGSRRVARDAALAALRDAEDTGACEAAWSRISSRMEAFFAYPEDVAPLRKVILTLAVQGRLVPQRNDDAPAHELLETIRAERRRRWVNQKRPYAQPLPRNFESVSSLLPPGWSLACIEELTDPVRTVSYGILKPGEDTPGGIPYVKVKDIRLKEGDAARTAAGATCSTPY